MKGHAHSRTHARRLPLPNMSELAATLPTSGQVAQARSELDAVIAFFQEARRSLDALPTSDGSGSFVDSTQQVVDRLLDRSKSNPALALAVRRVPRRTEPRTSTGGSDDEARRARELCDLINASM